MKFEELKFVRIDKPELFNLVPKRLFEQVKDQDFNVEKIYDLSGSFVKDPRTFFFVLVDEEAVIRGILWAFVSVINERVQVNLFSIDKEYQFGDALDRTLEFIRTWSDGLKIVCSTTRPKAYERAGWKQSKNIIMEID